MEFSGFIWGIFLIALVLLHYVWKNRYIYYCAWKLPGPLTLPFVGSFILIKSTHIDFFTTLMQICKRQKTIFKLGIGNYLYVVNSEPDDVEVLLKTCMGKSPFYRTWDELVNDKSTLVTAPVESWKEQRKEFNRSFNLQVLDTFHDIFLKYSKDAVKVLEQTSGQVRKKFMYDIWKCNLDIYLEALVDIDPQMIEETSELLNLVVRAEEILVERFKKLWLMVDPIYRLSRFQKETKSIAMEAVKFGQKILTLKKFQLSDFHNSKDDLRMKRLFNQICTFLSKKLMTEEEIVAETVIMAIAASETSAIAITYVILALGIFPDVQKKVYEEICSVAPNTDSFSPDDMNKMEYLERVIKETLRLLPVIPLIMRTVDEDTQLKSYTQPAGSHVIILISQIHKNPEFWPDPLKFDPDRFLPEEVEKRHRCAYIPFSLGPRNCIGVKYAMMSMKIMIAEIVKHFVIKTLNCNSLQDVELEYKMMNHPKNYQIVCEKRLKDF